ncbi:MAG: rod shape-determining protein RodA [Campylobacteraceae bacterium]|jgi:rod shape determining protein RodA|nr:rod shape-determining protein RodA [Campylobacteraceae bacterium]
MLYIDRRIITHFDILIPVIVIPIIALSYYLISESSSMLATKQLAYFLIGFGAFLLFFLIPIRKIEWLIPFFYWVGIVIIVIVEFLGSEKLGGQRWFSLPFTNFTIQPSEIFKPIFLLMLCYLIKQTPPPTEGYSYKAFAKISFFILLPFFLIAKQPDLGTATVLLIAGYGILFIVGVNKRIWIMLAVVAAVASPIVYNYALHDYQKKRILDFLGDTPSYHLEQSVIAIGSGGLLGKNKEEATQTQFKFLPIATSDFIFSALVERKGFFGGFALLLLYAFLIFHLTTLAFDFKNDYFTQVMATGIAFMLFIHAGVNIAMTIGFAPVVGIPLPLFSYGGSSFITFMIFFGILENLLAFRFDPTHKLVKYR